MSRGTFGPLVLEEKGLLLAQTRPRPEKRPQSLVKSEKLTKNIDPSPGIEPRPPGCKPGVLATRPRRLTCLRS